MGHWKNYLTESERAEINYLESKISAGGGSPVPDWTNYLTEAETRRLEEIDALRRHLTEDRQRLMNRAKQRKHRQSN